MRERERGRERGGERTERRGEREKGGEGEEGEKRRKKREERKKPVKDRLRILRISFSEPISFSSSITKSFLQKRTERERERERERRRERKIRVLFCFFLDTKKTIFSLFSPSKIEKNLFLFFHFFSLNFEKKFLLFSLFSLSLFSLSFLSLLSSLFFERKDGRFRFGISPTICCCFWC